MPTDTLTRRLGRIEFFATIPAGLLIFYFLYTAIYMLSWFRYGPGDTITLDLLVPVGEESSHLVLVVAHQVLLNYLTEHPTAIVLLVFVAYILGSIVRSFPLRSIGQFPGLRVKFSKYGNFPYPKIIIQTVEQLRSHSSLSGIDDPTCIPDLDNLSQAETDGALMDVYNFWKDDLVSHAPDEYAYYEAFESRSRFFAGMIWSGTIGCTVYLVSFLGMVLLAATKGLALAFFPYAFSFVLPLVLMIVFSLRLPHVREDEVKVLLMLHILQRQNRAKKDDATPNN